MATRRAEGGHYQHGRGIRLEKRGRRRYLVVVAFTAATAGRVFKKKSKAKEAVAAVKRVVGMSVVVVAGREVVVAVVVKVKVQVVMVTAVALAKGVLIAVVAVVVLTTGWRVRARFWAASRTRPLTRCGAPC